MLANTAAGRILAEISANRQSFAPSHLDTAVGDVQVFLPPDLPLNIEAVIDEAAGHRIFSEFPGLDIQGAREPLIFGTGRVRARCALNGGGKALMIHAVTGNIEIHRLDSQVLDRIRQRQQLYWKALDVRQQRQIAGLGQIATLKTNSLNPGRITVGEYCSLPEALRYDAVKNPTTDHWFVASAVGDTNGDGVYTTAILSSFDNQVTVENPND